METIKEEVWKPIIGFDGYEISNQKRVRCLRRKDPFILKPNVDESVHLRNGGTQHLISINRLFFATQHGVNPLKLAGTVIKKDQKTGELTIYTRKEHCDQMRKIEMDNLNLAAENCEKFYRDNILFSEMVLRAYKTGDWSEVATKLMSYEALALNYMYKCRFAFNKEVAQEAWGYVFENCLCGIRGGRKRIVVSDYYIRVVIRSYFAKRRMEKNLIVNYEDYNVGSWKGFNSNQESNE